MTATASDRIRVGAGITHVVTPRDQHCTCGKWQDVQYPCRHALSYFRIHMDKTLKWVMNNQVGDIHRYKTLQKLYKPNMRPVVVDTLRYDGITEPPLARRSAGRPKQQRFRRRSEHADPESSAIKCGRCGQRGHNRRTCKEVVVGKEDEVGEDTGTTQEESKADDNAEDNAFARAFAHVEIPDDIDTRQPTTPIPDDSMGVDETTGLVYP